MYNIIRKKYDCQGEKDMKTKRRMSKNEIKKKYAKSAGNFKRFFAYAIDWYITSLLVMAPVALLYSMQTGKKIMTIDIGLLTMPNALIAFGIGLVLCLFYLIIAPAKTGQTTGKRLFSIKIVKMDDQDVDLKTMIIREGIGVLLIEGVMFTLSNYFHQILLMGFGWPYSNYIAYAFLAVLIVSIVIAIIKPEKRMIHDYLAGTKVIKLK